MSHRINLMLLLAGLWASVYAAPLNQAVVFGSDTPSAQAAITALKSTAAGYNVPYIAYDTTASKAAATLPLYAGSTANFSMIILGSGTIGFSAAQWKQIYDYQELNGVRLVSLIRRASGTFAIKPANAIGSTAAGLPASYSLTFNSAGLGLVYPAAIVNAAAVTPVLSFSNATVSTAAVVYNFTAQRQQLSFFYQTAAWEASTAGSVSDYTNAILVSWVSKGVYGYIPPPVITGPPVNQAIVFGSETPSAVAAIASLKAYNVPYISYTTSESTAFTTIPLTTATTANFSMIILGGSTVAFSAAQFKQIYDYQNKFSVRLVALYDNPGYGFFCGLLTFTVSPAPASTIGSTAAVLGNIYPAKILNTTILPTLSHAAAVVYNFTTTQQQLSFFFQIADWDKTITPYATDILVSWLPHTANVRTRALILTPGDSSEEYPINTFQSYGLAYDVVNITAANVPLTPLSLEVTANVTGRYSIIVLIERSAFAKQLYGYQQYYGVRLVAINDYPTGAAYTGKLSAFGTATSCSTAALNIKPNNNVFTDPAGLRSDWALPVDDGIPNSSSVTPVLNFASVAAAVINFGRNQEQLSLFLPCGFWSTHCATIGNIWFQWATRGTYTGLRRVYFTPQIDDVFLETDGNNEKGQAVAFRISPADIQGLMNWMPDIKKRLPTGSNITIEMAYNGNGIMEYISKQNLANYHIDFDPDLTDTPLNWKKPLGTGKTLWPAGVNYNWNKTILAKDPIYNFFSAPGNLTSVTSKFLWCSHTFTHEILNNNTYSDTINEISFNFHLASKDLWGLDGQPYWSNKSMVTPGISGIFNGDALKALLDFGITGAVGDSSRPSLWNTERPMYWPMTTTVEKNGYAGFTVVPRQSLNIYFNTTNQEYNTILYNKIYGTTKTFADIMAIEVKRIVRTLLFLSWQPAMFHQANLRNADLPSVTIGGASGKWSLMQQWVESVFGTFAKIANWPVLSLSQDKLTEKFINRQIYETADVNVVQVWNVTASGVTTSGFSVSAAKSCVAPVTLPRTVAVADIVALPAGATTEQIGVFDSVTVWIPLTANANPVTITYKTAKTL
ncbi:hypothetical protein BDR26DRAFT_857406 [Obelidium mucronatum]|nr:hypothetical protein BDR26DRAFT_857406 [Obelidium mucronatum]